MSGHSFQYLIPLPSWRASLDPFAISPALVWALFILFCPLLIENVCVCVCVWLKLFLNGSYLTSLSLPKAKQCPLFTFFYSITFQHITHHSHSFLTSLLQLLFYKMIIMTIILLPWKTDVLIIELVEFFLYPIQTEQNNYLTLRFHFPGGLNFE